MITWFRIAATPTSPARQIYQDPRALTFLDMKQARHALLKDAGSLKATTGTENTSMVLTLKNGMGECTTLFAIPPLAALVTVFGDDAEQFEGIVTQIEITPTESRLTVQA